MIVALLLGGCSSHGHVSQVEVGYACQFNGGPIRIEMERFSFKLPEYFLGRKCSNFVDYSHDKLGDWFSIGGRSRRVSAEGVSAEVFSVGLKLTGGAAQMKIEHFLSPEDFLDFKWDQSVDGESPKLIFADWIDREGARCVRLKYLSKNSMREIGRVEHWCWSHVEKLSVPYGVSAYEVIAVGGEWGIDLEDDIFSPIFSSMELRDLSEEYNKSFADRKSVLCARHIKSFEERGVGWLSGKTLEPKWTPVLLDMCGYDLRGNS